MSQLENKVLLLARPESVYGQDSIAPALLSQPSAYQTDAMAVSNLDVRVNGEALTRENYSPSLSKERTGMGRMLLQLTFRTELKASGSLGVAPRIGRLLKAAGMSETIIAATAAATIGNPVQGATNSSAAMATIATTSTDTTAPTKCFDTYRLTATTGGAPGTAKFIVSGAGFPDNDTAVMPSLSHTYSTNTINGVVAVGGTVVAPTFTFSGTWVKDEFVELFVGGVRFYYQIVTGDTPTTIATALVAAIKGDARFSTSTSAAGVITIALSAGGAAAPGAGEFTSSASAQAVTLGQSGAVITLPAWTGNLVAGEFIDIPLLRPGVRYDPVSDNVTSLTFYVYLDGTLLKLTGSRGTFTVEGQSARYPVVNWTFTGIYNDPVDAALPTTAVYENSKPWKVELSQLAFYGVADNACASRFAFDMANTVEAKDCINASEGYDEIRITDRTPTAGADPESDKPSKMNPWWRVRREDTTRMHVAVGRRGGVGNIVRIQGDNANFRDVPFANRNRIRAYDFQMALARVTATGNDELFFHFS